MFSRNFLILVYQLTLHKLDIREVAKQVNAALMQLVNPEDGVSSVALLNTLSMSNSGQIT
jgi:hypothetical protein